MEWLTVTEAQKRAKVSRATLYRHITSGKLEKKKENGKTFIRAADLLSVMKEKIKKQSPTTLLTKRIEALEHEVAELKGLLGISSKSTWSPQDLPLFRDLIKQILKSEPLKHKAGALRSYIEKLPPEKAAEAFDSVEEVSQCYESVLTYLMDQHDTDELERLLSLKWRVEMVKVRVSD